MRIKYLATVLAVLLLIGIGYCPGSSAEKKEGKQETASSTLDDQIGVALTIYNVNLGLVKDQHHQTVQRHR